MTGTDPSPKKRLRIARYLQQVLFVAILVYGCIIGYLIWNETRLVYPGAPQTGNYEPEFAFEDVWVSGNDDTKIHGWYLPHPNATRNILLFHGNAEDVPGVAERYARKIAESANANILIYDYRSFGKSEGVPNEANTISDGIVMLNWLLKKANLETADQGIIYYGSSLGGGVAVGVAEKQPPAALILDRTFDSIVTPAAETYPWIPVRYIMRNQFDSVKRIKNLEIPFFQSHFEDDELCKIEHAKKLFRSATKIERKRFLELPNGGHYLPLPESYFGELEKFIEGLDKTQVRQHAGQSVTD